MTKGPKFMTTFFAAANSEEGFVSLFDEIFSPDSLKQIYILKGGPGSGKSTLMRSIGAEAEALGLKTEYLFCSSDTDSLDGIIIPAVAAAILDGTAPHAKDPVYPGVAERIVNLGEAFDHEALARKKSLIEAQIREKAACYRSAYRFLSAAGIMERERIALLGSVYLSEKAKAAANRLINSLRELPKGPSSHRYLSAIGTKGIVRLSAPAHKHYAVTESHGAGYLFMQALYEALTEKGAAMTVCKTPLSKDRIEAIILKNEDLCFSVCDEKTASDADKTVNCLRFLQKEKLSASRSRLREAEKHVRALTESAVLRLREAGACHARTETIYGTCIDFKKIDAVQARLRREIFKNIM